MKFLRLSTLASIAAALLLICGAWYATSNTALAQTVAQGIAQGIGCSGPDCQACNVVKLVQNIILYAIGLTIPIAILLFAWAGILLFTSGGNPSRLEQAKKILQSALIGFVIVLGAYLIINTILMAIVNKNYYQNGSWFNVSCTDQARPINKTLPELFHEVFGSTPAAQVVVPETTNGGTGGTGTGSAFFTSSNVQLASGVSVVGMQQSTIDEIDTVASQCGCTVLVTSGTTGGHTEGSLHYEGLAADVQVTSSLTNYLSGLTPVSNIIDRGLPAYQDPTTGYIWSEESSQTPGSSGPHYHVSVNGH